MDYKVIDADSHVNSPPDLWTSRVPAKYKDRAPKIVNKGDFDAWVVDNGPPNPISILSAAAGYTPEQLSRRFIHFEEMMPGAHDPKESLANLDSYCNDAQGLYGDGAMGAAD